MRLYHRTSPEAAQEILSTQQFKSLENTRDIYGSTMLKGQAQGFGSAVVEVEVPDDRAALNDEFPSGEQHYAFQSRHARVVRVFEDEPDEEYR
jgi:hypothetical protein